MGTNFHAVDAAILLLYLATLTGIGIHFSRRQQNLEDYLLADRSIAWLPVGLSLMAALNSGIDYLMQPSAVIRYGLVLLVGTSSWLFLYPWVAHVTLPFYRRLNLYSAYEYLEARFDVRVRALAAGIFLLWRLGWMATALYVPCLAVNAATNGLLPLVPTIVVLGAVVTLYTMLGGIRAVIWTDVIQFGVMFGGLAATVAIVVAHVPGGVGQILAGAEWVTPATRGGAGGPEVGGLAAVARFFTDPISVTGVLVATLVGRMATYTSDQIMIQRFQTTKSVADGRRAFVINGAGDVLWMVGLAFIGLALAAYFRQHPVPGGLPGDRILPLFMAQAFPAGAVGLVIAAIFAASLSSIDSAINACTAVVTVDFYDRLYRNRAAPETPCSPAEQRAQVRVSRIATVGLGIAATVLASNVPRLGDLIEICNRLINAFTGPLFGIFLLGMFARRARAEGVLAGGLLGTLTTLWAAHGSRLGFLWPSSVGLAATLLVGYGVCLLLPPTGGSKSDLTWRNVMKRSLPDDDALPPAPPNASPPGPTP
jgi:SSS family transporter